MKVIILKGIAIFLLLIVATSVMVDVMQTNFGDVDYFKVHGIFFLILITIFPRLTLLLSSVATGGFFWWLGFFFWPRILVASLATVAYFHTNPVLVVISWIVALGGETMEKAGLARKKSGFVFKTFRYGNMGSAGPYAEPASHQTIKTDDAIEAEFTKKS